MTKGRYRYGERN